MKFDDELIDSETKYILRQEAIIGRLRGLIFILIVVAIAAMTYVYAS